MIRTAFLYLPTDQLRYDTADNVAPGLAAGYRPVRRQDGGRPDRARRRGWAGCRPTRRSTATRSTSPTPPSAEPRRRRLRRRAAQVRPAGLRLRGPGRRGELAARADGLAVQPARLQRQGQRVLPAPPARRRGLASARVESPPEARPSDVRWRDEAPAGKLDLLLSLDFRMTSHDAVLRRRAAGRDLVREARPVQHGHAPVRARVHPRDPPAVADPHRLRRVPRARRASSASSPRPTSAPARTSSPCRCCTTPRTRWPTRTASVRDWRADGTDPIPGVNFPKLVVVERDYGAVAEKLGALGPLADSLGATTKGVTYDLGKSVDYLSAKNGVVRGGVADGRPSLARDAHACEAILAMSGTTNGHLAVSAASRRWSSAPARDWPTWPPSTRASRSPSPTPRPGRSPVITSPEWSGSEAGGRRYSAVHDQRRAARSPGTPSPGACTSSSTTTG